MGTSENDKDVALLHSSPRELIVKYQGLVRIIVQKYVRSGMFREDEMDDIAQSVNEQLLLRISSMQTNYNGMALFKTYLSAIVRNICLKMRRRDDEPVSFGHLPETAATVNEDITTRQAIDDDLRRFGRILAMYGPSSSRVVLTLKLTFRLEIRREDILRAYPSCSSDDVEQLLGLFGGDYDAMTMKDIYEKVTPIINKSERKENTADALRNWINPRIDEIIVLLNGRQHRANYDKETLRILAERYFSILPSRTDIYR